MILEVESTYGDAIIHGKNFRENELRTIVKELLSNVDESKFVSNFCIRYDYELLPYDDKVKVDYTIDLDTHIITKPKY